MKGQVQKGRGLLPSAVLRRNERAVGKGPADPSRAERSREEAYFPFAVVKSDQRAIGKGPAGPSRAESCGKGPTSLSSSNKEPEHLRQGISFPSAVVNRDQRAAG